jgi:hypothetical protein
MLELGSKIVGTQRKNDGTIYVYDWLLVREVDLPEVREGEPRKYIYRLLDVKRNTLTFFKGSSIEALVDSVYKYGFQIGGYKNV